MKLTNKKRPLKSSMGIVALLAVAAVQLSGCPRVEFPPIAVELDVVMNVEVPALASSTGSASIALDEFCGLFNAAELEALIRAAAGGAIGSDVGISRVLLASTDIVATDGDFGPFDTAVLDVMVNNSGGNTLLLGTAESNDGLGTAFSLTLEDPVDLRNDLRADQCGGATLHLTGAGILEAGSITFDASVTLLVYTVFPAQ